MCQCRLKPDDLGFRRHFLRSHRRPLSGLYQAQSRNSPSFPGKWESRNAKPQELIRNNSNLKFVIPTKVGIQFVEFQLFKINFETLIPSFPRKR
ncbi:hypothetical protein CHT69_07170, partial [Neisseria gonorrhoeae]